MGKLKNKDTLEVKASRLKIVPVGGWTWYCGYHDAYGLGDDEDEVLFMSGAHMHYHMIDGDVCEMFYKEHTERKEA